ncbi:hypothetical protein MMC11_007024 [Xylographa trunciseda]|nr:hypothetical protein [Xylographa trunciseda]
MDVIDRVEPTDGVEVGTETLDPVKLLEAVGLEMTDTLLLELVDEVEELTVVLLEFADEVDPEPLEAEEEIPAALFVVTEMVIGLLRAVEELKVDIIEGEELEIEILEMKDVAKVEL